MKSPKYLFILISAVLASGLYVLFSAIVYRFGFPLDDAWIHQTYARNFASGYGWSFEPGIISGGTTAPLWTLLLSLGYLLRVHPAFYTFGLGIVFFVGAVFLAIRYFDRANLANGLLGLFFLFEWHYVWASVSGMETILAIFLILAVVYSLKYNQVGWELAILLAVSIWVRPDLLTLSFPVLVYFLLNRRAHGRMEIEMLLPFLLIMISLSGYLVFNQRVSEAWFPTTFYAKQAEYAELQRLPLAYRLWQQFSVAFVGGGALLLPGFFCRLFQSLRDRDWLLLAWAGWFGIMITLYATRLPVIYQHGRYILPATVIYYLIGIEGCVSIYRWMIKKRRIGWILAKTGFWAWVVITGIFWVLGANAYAKDVQIIETQMVDIARWAEDNLPANSRIAVHDIGAMGYFTTRDLIDLAGLVNPEVIPILRDEEKLAEFLYQQRVDYLICFPSWYPKLVSNLRVVHRADQVVVQPYNETPMTIYEWR